jgi:hypothetical protein
VQKPARALAVGPGERRPLPSSSPQRRGKGLLILSRTLHKRSVLPSRVGGAITSRISSAVTVPAALRPSQLSKPGLGNSLIPLRPRCWSLKTLQAHSNFHSIDESGEFQSNEYAESTNLNSNVSVEPVARRFASAPVLTDCPHWRPACVASRYAPTASERANGRSRGLRQASSAMLRASFAGNVVARPTCHVRLIRHPVEL